MKAIISSTYSDNYLFFIPIVSWLWDKLGVQTICFIPEVEGKGKKALDKFVLALGNSKYGLFMYFNAPEHKEATYAQVSRLYGAALDLPDDEILITSDIDMALFRVPPAEEKFSVFGYDLVPDNQYPMCYLSASVKEWRKVFDINSRSLQQCLDDALAHEDCENMRGNLWCRDQETAFNHIRNTDRALIARATLGTQFSSNRIDRDDSFWKDRLTPDIVDAHLWRPGFTKDNFANILELIRYFYPNEDLQWMIDYRNEYLKLI